VVGALAGDCITKNWIGEREVERAVGLVLLAGKESRTSLGSLS